MLFMKTILLLFLCIAFLSSCGDSTLTKPENINPTVYFPLKVGNTWTYYFMKDKVPIEAFTIMVTSTEVIKGQTYFVLYRSPRYENFSPEYLRVENDKVYKFEDDKESLYIDFVNQNKDCGNVDTTMDSIDTKLGTLHNVKYVSFPGSGSDAAPYNSYAPNIGLIATGYEGPSYYLWYAKIDGKIYQ